MKNTQMTHLLSKLACAGVFVAITIATATSHAAELRWRSKPFQIVANEKPLADFLRELAASQGTTAVIDQKVEGVISGKFSVAGGAQVILDSICATYGLTWYYDGSFLFIDPVNEVVNKVIPISEGSAARLRDTIDRLQIADSRYPLVVNEREGTTFVSGPKRYVELVSQAVELADDPEKQAGRAVIRFFPLKYARAADIQIVRDGQPVTVFGVASILGNLFDKRTGALASALPGLSVGATRQVKLSSGETANVPKIEGFGLSTKDKSGGATSELPQFQADTGRNGVLIRDLPHRMGQYENLIATLDIRPRLIEIEVTIMDISSDKLNSLGVDWRAHGEHADLQIGRGITPPLTYGGATTEAGQTGSFAPAGVVFTGSIGNSVREYLLTRVSALAQSGQANFIARPKVSTLDNVEAILESMNEFYVRLQGQEEVGLFNVKAGTSVRVTPMIVDEPSGQGIMMTINIHDGSLGPVLADNLPSIRRRTVSTQTLVEEGKSLLIAGYSSEELSNVETGVPGLSAIPVLGNLFKYKEKKQVNMERFYLLTPRMTLASEIPKRAPELKLTPEATSIQNETDALPTESSGAPAGETAQ